jgi:3-keto-5-aminohexanoate cleavage enzyme
MRPVIIAVAPNGGRRSKADHPALPMTAAEIAREAPPWVEAGASVLHLHVRGREGGHSLDAGLYTEATAAVRAAVGDRLVIQITTEAIGLYGPDEQMEVVRQVRPEAVSLALRELAPTDEAGAFAEFLAWLKSERIATQLILYDRADAERLAGLAEAGRIDPATLSVLYVLGRYAERQRGEPAELLPMRAVPLSVRDWMVCCFGPEEPRAAALAALLGGHARVGFENNFARPDGSPARDNADLVATTTAALRALGFRPAEAGEVRRAWGID